MLLFVILLTLIPIEIWGLSLSLFDIFFPCYLIIFVFAGRIKIYSTIYFILLTLPLVFLNIAFTELQGSYLLWAKQFVYLQILYSMRCETKDYSWVLTFAVLIFNLWALYHLFLRFRDFGGFVTLDVLPYGYNLNSWAYVNLLLLLLVDNSYYRSRRIFFCLKACLSVLILISASRLAIISLIFYEVFKRRRSWQYVLVLIVLIVPIIYILSGILLIDDYGELVIEKLSKAHIVFVNQRLIELTILPIITWYTDFWQYVFTGNTAYIGHSIVSSVLITGGLVLSFIYLVHLILFHSRNIRGKKKRKYLLILVVFSVGMFSTNLSFLTHYTGPLMFMVYRRVYERENEIYFFNRI